MITVVISGGQTGADTGALVAAASMGVRTCGYMPRGLEREGGGGAEIAAYYGLHENTTGPLRSPLGPLVSTDNAYKWRDMANVGLASHLLAVRLTAPGTGKGTMQTMHYALEGAYEFHPERYAHRGADVDEHEGALRVLSVWDPHLLAGDRRQAVVDRIVAWLDADGRPGGLMVSGPLESTAPGVDAAVADLLGEALDHHRAHAGSHITE